MKKKILLFFVFVSFFSIYSVKALDKKSETDLKVINNKLELPNHVMKYNQTILPPMVSNVLTGFQVIDGETYYFDKYGNIVTGLQQIGEYTYYFEENGRLFSDGLKTLNGKTYFFSRVDGRMRTGMFEVDYPLNTYYFDDTTGEMKTGLQTVGEYTYYFEENGRLFSDGLKTLNGKTYFFSRVDGRMRTGMFEVDYPLNTYYFDDTTGEMKTGLQTINGNTYYFEADGKMYHNGFKQIEGKTYFFSRVDGRMRTGMFEVDYPLNIYYFDDTTGEMKTGLQTINGNTYYFEENGKLFSSGLKTLNGKTYFFSRVDGRMRTGMFEVDYPLNNYYFDETTGEMKTGVQTVGEYTYYFEADGKMYHNGFKQIDGKTYFFSRVDGRMRTGMFTIDDVYYYFDEVTGEMKTGYQVINGITYYFNEDGSLYNGFYDIKGNQYYMQPDGTRATGWHTIQGVKYYFNNNGMLIARDAKFIIDVSSWQGIINWDAVKQEGKVDGVILRMAINDVLVDTQFERNLRELQRLGIPYGVYLYSYAENGTEAKMEADWMVTLLKRYQMNPTYGIYFDIEEWTHLTPTDFDAIIPTFINTVKQAGYSNVGIYAAKNYINQYFSQSVRPYVTWVAQYYYYCNYQGSYQMWQYGGGNEGEFVSGINGRVDSNVWSNSFLPISQ